MSSPAPERPRYSTGFRIWLAGLATAGIGVAIVIWVWEPLGIALIVLGGIPAVWFKYPTDWRRTWPDDFPVAARLVGGGRSGRSRFTDTVYDDSRRAWNRLPPRRRLLESVFMAALGAGVIVFAAADPHGFFSGFEVRAWAAIVAAPVLLVLAIVRARRALHDLRGRQGSRSMSL